jgi:hypothetical protein
MKSDPDNRFYGNALRAPSTHPTGIVGQMRTGRLSPEAAGSAVPCPI